jgi:fructose-1,6-bisphosphatase/inositol monophosphatase family enzyme
MSPDELAAIVAILTDAARAEVMPRFGRLGAGEVRAKSGPQDLVTEADEAAERAIHAALEARFPGCVVVGEEAASADPRLLAQLGDAKLAFVVDPIDGTYNYAAGVPLFGVMAAAIERGAITAGAILDPVVGETACALRGGGAWMEGGRDGRRALRVAAGVPLERMAGLASWHFMRPDLRARVLAGLARVSNSWSYRCAAHEYRMTASGAAHFQMYNKLMPWDHAPGALILTEAGGHVARFDGSAYGPTTLEGGLICATDPASWATLRDALVG